MLLFFLLFPSTGNSLVFLLIFTGIIYVKMYRMLKKKATSSSVEPMVRQLYESAMVFSAECTIGMVWRLTALKHYGNKALWR